MLVFEYAFENSQLIGSLNCMRVVVSGFVRFKSVFIVVNMLSYT